MVFVYLLKSIRDNSYYSGITVDLKKRLMEHNAQRGKYSSKHAPYELVWIDRAVDYKDARRIEKWLKKRSRKEKEDLIVAAQLVPRTGDEVEQSLRKG